MAGIYIRHKSQAGQYLKYDCETGSMREVSANAIADKPCRKAFYVPFADGFMGVIGSERGPFFFINHNKFYFSDLDWTVKVERKEAENIFYVIKGDAELLREKYSPPPLDALDPWSDEESEDFFVWITSKRYDEEFKEMWSL